MALVEYRKKRRFDKTPEPGPEERHSTSGRLFVIQKHRASHLHYDFRLESDGVLKSWAVPKGPSLDPADKRLAMKVEDHPVDYADFEGIIPEGEYGGGTVMIWDTGTYTPENGENVSAAIDKGELKFILHGKKLRGSFALVRTRDRQWLLIKHNDKYASKEKAITEAEPFSVVTKRTLSEIAEDEGGDRAKAATGDPAKVPAHKRARKPRGEKPSVWRSNRASDSGPVASKRANVKPRRMEVPDGARRTAMPLKVQPMLATLVDEPFTDKDWIFETKWDGVRALCFLKNGKHRLVSRNQLEMTAQYPELSDLHRSVDAETAILDGEIVALDQNGMPRFQLLQPRFGRKKNGPVNEAMTIVFYVFDLVYYNGYDLSGCRLEDRRALLKQILAPAEAVRFSDSVKGRGKALFELVEKIGLEGIIGKRSDSKYVQKRSSEWLKIKTMKRQEVVIGGYTEPNGTRAHFGALVVGLYERGRKPKLRYVGHTGTGFDARTLSEVYKRLQPLKTAKSPFDSPPETNMPVQWVRPELVCEIKFAEWTNDWHMRHPVFMGLREDKEPSDCLLEIEHDTAEELAHAEEDTKSRRTAGANGAGKAKPASILLNGRLSGNVLVKIRREVLRLTNLDKVYWPGDGITKGDLIRYYYEIAPTMLPYYKDRPLILKRYPNGIEGQVFHQHNLEKPPEFIDTFIRENDEGEKVVYGIANNPETLLYLANLGAVSLHPWAARAGSPEKPDWIIFDVDPGEAKFETVCDVALEVKRVLDEIGLESFPKTSGSKGIHVYVPVRPLYSYDQVVPFANLVAAVVARDRPDIVSIERMRVKRKKGRVYLDYLQNGFGKTVAGPYSVRARPGATLSAPVLWDEIRRKRIKPSEFTIRTLFKRLEKKGDIFRPLLGKKQTLTQAVARLSDIFALD